MNLWDTAGQERFLSLTKSYVEEAAAVLLVYDSTFKESLDGARTWFNQIKQQLDLDEVILALVGNKCDNLED